MILLLSVAPVHLEQGGFRGDTGWYSAIGVQAWRTGSLWTLMSEPGVPYFNKPPLGLWIHGLVLWIFGVGLLQARMPTVLVAAACVFVVTRIARTLSTRKVALASGCSLALSYEFFRRSREISLDMWLLLWFMLALWCAACAFKRNRPRLLVVMGVPIGLALMTKPLVGLVGLVMIGLWLVWCGRRQWLGYVAAAGAVGLMVAAPWHIWMVLQWGDVFVGQYFGAETVQRSLGQRHDSGGEVPIWFYVQKLVTTGWPWILFACLWLISIMRGVVSDRHKALSRLAIVWAVGWLILLTVFPDRRDRYSLVYQPGVAMLAGLWLGSLPWGWIRILNRPRLMRLSALVAGAALVAWLLPIRVQQPANEHWIALKAWLSERDNVTLYQGGFNGPHGARVYLLTGQWPVTTRDATGRDVNRPEPGAYLIYHRRDGLVPGEGEDVIWENGDLLITQLASTSWQPVPVDDPGEREGE